jgi:hypothetical protein
MTALRRDGRDRSIMTPYSVGTEASREWVTVSPERARVGRSLADTADPALKVRGRACPFKTACWAQVWDFVFPSSSFSRARSLLSEFFCIRRATASCASSPFEPLLP